MLARGNTYTIVGLDAVRIEIEVDAAHGLPALTIVGLPDQAVKEARERVRSALLNSQFDLPPHRLTVNLAPADLKKEGGAFDLPIALAILAASGQLDPAALERVAAIGELALDGTVRPGRGTLPVALAVRRTRPEPALLVPRANAAEAAVVSGARIIPVDSLRQAADYIAGRLPIPESPAAPRRRRAPDHASVDFSDVKGQQAAKRALEVAVAGGHHVLLIGPPGAGKSMLAQRLPTILPALTWAEALEATKIHSIMGLLPPEQPLLTQRPFRSPHHTSSAAALVGGGTVPRPGEMSLAHHGVLFLDELPEFHRDVLESLRQPLEDGVISVARAKRAATFPSRVMLVAAMNPCPCGYLTDARRRCSCPQTKVERYLAKLSGPLLDRIDVHIAVPAVPVDVLSRAPEGESSERIRLRVRQAQAWRRKRGQDGPNAQLRTRELKTHCRLAPDAQKLLNAALEELRLSARSYTKILKLARTIADLARQPVLQAPHVAEAIQYRSLDRQWWVRP